MPVVEFGGAITALVTPFKDNEIDYNSLKRLLRFQLEAGINGLVVNGTTAESPSLSISEVESIFKFVKSEVAGEIPLILGTGSNCTAKTSELTKRAHEWGPSAFLIVVPYYNKPPQRGMIQHFTAVAKTTSLPIILYNVPGRTIASIEPKSIAELSSISNIIGIKEASAQMSWVPELRASCEAGFQLLSGDDESCFEFMRLGGQGVVSVISNVVPKEMASFAKRACSGDEKVTEEFQKNFGALNRALNIEANPIPVKRALNMMGIIETAEMRLPLVQLENQWDRELYLALEKSAIKMKVG